MPKKLRTLFFIIVVYFSSILINVLWANDAIKILPKGTRAILDLRDLPSNSLSVYAVNIDTNEVYYPGTPQPPRILLQS